MRYRVFLPAFVVLFALSVHASILVLANGDRLTGTVLKKADGKIYFHTEILGDIVAPESAVTIVEPPPSSTPVDSLASLPPAPPKPVQPATPGTTTVTPAGTAGSSGTAGPITPVRLAQANPVKPPVTPWTGKFEFGYDNQLTNIRTVATTLRAELDRTVRADDFLLKGRYLYGKSDGTPTVDQADGEFRLRHNLDTRVFLQSDATVSDDKIQRINFEGAENAGIGYKLLPGARHVVDVGVGVTGQYLNAMGIQKGWDYLGSVFQDYTYKINGRYTFTEDASAQYSPDKRGRFGLISTPLVSTETGNVQDYAYKFHATLQGKINKHLSLNLHFDYEFNNVVLDPAARGEQRITTTVGYGF